MLQLDASVILPTMVAGLIKEPILSDVWTVGSPKFMKFGILLPAELRVKFTRHINWMLALESWESSHPIKFLKVGVGSPLLVKYTLMEVWNIWAFLTSTRPVGPFGMIISWLPVLVGKTVVTPPIINGELNLGYLMEVFPSRGFFLSLTVRIMYLGFRKIHAPRP